MNGNLMMMRILLALILFVFIPLDGADAQKNCKKGIPYGNSCISATKTCLLTLIKIPTPEH